MNWTYHDRHWMHIWKVGYRPCISCNRDSRVVASLLDDDGEIVEQKLFCEEHAPRIVNSERNTPSDVDPITSINLELGATFSIELPPESDE